MQMSSSESSCTKPRDIGHFCVGEDRADSADGNNKSESNDCSSVKERVLKEVGLTSTTFIGPALPLGTNKSDIDDKLSEFYKELEKVDTSDGASGNPGKQDEGFVHPPTPLKISNTKETQDVSQERFNRTSESEEADSYEKSSGQKQSSWPHWYQNEPYYSRRPRWAVEVSTGGAAYAQNQWRHPQPWHRVPNTRFHRPPFHHPAPPFEVLNLQNPPLHTNPNWNESGMFCRFPPPNDCGFPSQGLYENSKHPFDRDKRDCSYNPQTENVNVRWPRDREEEWSQLGEHSDWRRRFDSENEEWEQQHHCRPPDNTHSYHPSLVLIMMRGLPGSGKSTLARYMLV